MHIACTHLGHAHMAWVKSSANHVLIDELNNQCLAPELCCCAASMLSRIYFKRIIYVSRVFASSGVVPTQTGISLNDLKS